MEQRMTCATCNMPITEAHPINGLEGPRCSQCNAARNRKTDLQRIRAAADNRHDAKAASEFLSYAPLIVELIDALDSTTRAMEARHVDREWEALGAVIRRNNKLLGGEAMRRIRTEIEIRCSFFDEKERSTCRETTWTQGIVSFEGPHVVDIERDWEVYLPYGWVDAAAGYRCPAHAKGP